MSETGVKSDVFCLGSSIEKKNGEEMQSCIPDPTITDTLFGQLFGYVCPLKPAKGIRILLWGRSIR